MTTYFDMIEAFDQHLDNGVSEQYHSAPLAQDWARISKVSEELGECIQNFIGVTGQNPRKGYYSSQVQVLEELADVANTAILAIQHFCKDQVYTSILVHERLANACERVGLITKETE